MEPGYYLTKYTVNENNIRKLLFARKDGDKIVDVQKDQDVGPLDIDSVMIEYVNKVFHDLKTDDILYFVVLCDGYYEYTADVDFTTTTVNIPNSILNFNRITAAPNGQALATNKEDYVFLHQEVAKTIVGDRLFGNNILDVLSELRKPNVRRSFVNHNYPGFLNYKLINKTFRILSDVGEPYGNILILSSNPEKFEQNAYLLNDNETFKKGLYKRTTVTTQEMLVFAANLGFKNVVILDFSCNTCLKLANETGELVSEPFAPFANRFNQEAFPKGYRI
jgi:hypothetical protein